MKTVSERFGRRMKVSVFVIATVKKRATTFETRVRQPRSLAPNQFAVHLTMEVDENDWLKRVKEISLGRVRPPELRAEIDDAMIGPTTAETVLKRMTSQ
jgi:hypothetical protein